MVQLVFYEKPGCINNTRQKNILRAAGHQVESRNILTEDWSREKLLDYFSGLDVPMWFNQSAPEIKSGRLDIEALDECRALELMLNNPILIRRPLMRVADDCRVGFEPQQVEQWIGLQDISGAGDIETCAKQQGHSCNITPSAKQG